MRHLKPDDFWRGKTFFNSQSENGGGNKGSKNRFFRLFRVYSRSEQGTMGYRRIGDDETRLSVYTAWLQRGYVSVVFAKNWKRGRGHQFWLVSMQKASLGTVVTAIASTLGATHKYARRLVFFGKSSRQKW